MIICQRFVKERTEARLSKWKLQFEHMKQRSASLNWKEYGEDASHFIEQSQATAEKNLIVLDGIMKAYQDKKNPIENVIKKLDLWETKIYAEDEDILGMVNSLIKKSVAKVDVNFSKKKETISENITMLAEKEDLLKVVKGAIENYNTGNREDAKELAAVIREAAPHLEKRRPGIAKQFFDLVDKFMKKIGEALPKVKVGVRGALFTKSAEKKLQVLENRDLHPTLKK